MKCANLNCFKDSVQDSKYCFEHDLQYLVRSSTNPEVVVQFEKQKALQIEKIAQLQKDSFPTDSFWLYQLQVIKRDGSTELQFALPNDYANQDTSSEIIFYDIIVGDSIYERGFLGCSVIITKRMFFSFEDIHMLPNLTVVDNVVDSGKQYVRASRVLRSLPGIRNTVPINKKG